jgi:branched-subunit amino acid ABC-type transport system permease component
VPSLHRGAHDDGVGAHLVGHPPQFGVGVAAGDHEGERQAQSPRPLLGLLAHLLVFRPLRNAPALGKVIGAVGIMLYLQAVASLNFGAEARQNPGFLPSTSGDKAFFTNFLGLGNLPHLIVWMAGCAIVMGAAVWALLTYTRFGLATRAADENEKGASLLGYSPQLLAGLNWVLSALLAGITGLVVIGLGSLQVDRFTLYVIPALGAALVGNLTSIPLAVAGGFLIGMFQSGMVKFDRKTEKFQAFPLPAGVVNFCPGSGATFGNGVVEHPKTRYIAFTGSKEVGLDINERAAKTPKGQVWIKRTVLEMGGKDSIVVDDDCNLDDAAKGVVAAAFGFQGQKCSACSRAIVHENVYDQFVKKVLPLVSSLKQGAPYESKDINMGPVINEGAATSILEYIEAGKTEGELLAGGMRAAGDGYFIQPTVFGNVPPDATISLEEIFGPVLAIIKAKDFDNAIEIANNTEYGLTGAVYSNKREHLEQARRDFHVGNLYLNRKCTGALVGVHPFGGFNISGTDSKAGGRDYLLLFTQAKVMSEKVK